MDYSLKNFADFYVNKLNGSEDDNAYHSLIEADPSIVPILIQAYRKETKLAIKTTLIEILSHHRHPATLEFLTELLNNSFEKIWKPALNGLVMHGGEESLTILENVKQNISPANKKLKIKIEWIDEALGQIEKRLRRLPIC